MLDLSLLAANAPRLLSGALTTLALASIAIVGALCIGTLLGTLRSLDLPAVRAITRVYVDVIRGTPLLIQMYLIYYALPAFGVTLDAFPSAAIALTLNSSAYITEIVRGSINSVPRSQLEAGRALAMTPRRIYVRIVAPQALVVAVPALVGEFIDVVKWSSVASIVVVAEITQVATTIIGRTFSFVGYVQLSIVVTVFYLAITSSMSFVGRRTERRLSRHLVARAN
jgi:polar amino acid transport system permease protein/polar amino acid transport system substrate-binding protein